MSWEYTKLLEKRIETLEARICNIYKYSNPRHIHEGPKTAAPAKQKIPDVKGQSIREILSDDYYHEIVGSSDGI